jgi:hypothetical protein
MQEKEIFRNMCVKAMEKKGLLSNRLYVDRLKKEIKEVDAQAEHEYYIKLHDKFQREGLIFPANENNALIDYLLDLALDFDIDKPYAFVQGEMPDIDVDFIKKVRDWLKKEWAIARYGQEYVCEIGTYGTLGIKSAILDVTRVHGVPKDEIQSITVKMEDKDEEGKLLEWDKALELYPEFKAYCEKHPDIAADAKDMHGRIKTGGVHAGGLIVSSVRLDGFVPLEVRSVNKTTPRGVICSAWGEGLQSQDLGPVGLIKFDLLVIANLLQIAYGSKLVKDRHDVKSICAVPGGEDWSDISYLNDPLAIAMANRGDLRCIFQFDGEGMRRLVKKGLVSNFDDLVAYTALYRPGPLNCLAKGSKVKTSEGEKSIEDLVNWYDKVAYLNKDGKIAYTHKFAIWKTGKKRLVKIKTKGGKELVCSLDHPVLTEKGKYVKTENLKIGEKVAII